jgi:Endoribonuclease L-PSP
MAAELAPDDRRSSCLTTAAQVPRRAADGARRDCQGGHGRARSCLVAGSSDGIGRRIVERMFRSAGMDLDNLVSLRTYLADPQYDEANVRMRVKFLGSHAPSSTVICCQLLDPRWKLEIEAMAAT